MSASRGLVQVVVGVEDREVDFTGHFGGLLVRCAAFDVLAPPGPLGNRPGQSIGMVTVGRAYQAPNPVGLPPRPVDRTRGRAYVLRRRPVGRRGFRRGPPGVVCGSVGPGARAIGMGIGGRQVTIPGMVLDAAERFGKGEAVVEGDLRYSFAEVEGRMLAVARALVAVGVEPGDRVGLWAPNSAAWIFSALGVLAAGASLVPLNTRFRGRRPPTSWGRWTPGRCSPSTGSPGATT